jgi:hypothetical protein
LAPISGTGATGALAEVDADAVELSAGMLTEAEGAGVVGPPGTIGADMPEAGWDG